MGSRITSAVLLAACFAVLIMVCTAVGEGQRPVPRIGVRPGAKEMKGSKGMRPIPKDMKVTQGMRPIPKGTRPIPKGMDMKEMPPKPDMPPMPGMPPMPDTAPAPSPNASSFTYPSLVVGFLALVAAFCA